jgi:CHAT domain-containing protein/Tfp pilus assembly protein PilF
VSAALRRALLLTGFVLTSGSVGAAPCPDTPPGSASECEQKAGLAAEGAHDYLEALGHYLQALSIDRALKERGVAGSGARQSNDLIHVANIYRFIQQHTKALDYFQQALAIQREIGDRQAQALTLTGIGGLYSALGEYDKAVDYQLQALSLFKELGSPGGQALCLTEIAGVMGHLGRYSTAFDYYQRALIIQRRFGNRWGEAGSLHAMGDLYSDLGQDEKALDYLRKALAIRRETGYPRDDAAILVDMASAYGGLGQYDNALDYAQQALTLFRKFGSRGGELVALSNIGYSYKGLGQPAKALDYHQQALSIARQTGNRSGEAVNLIAMGVVTKNAGSCNEAVPQFHQASLIGDELSSPEIQWRARDDLSACLVALHRPEEAIFWGKQAVNAIQALRQGAARLDPGLQLSFMKDKKEVYESISDLLIDQDRLPEAEQVLGMLKQEEYFDFIQRDAAKDPRQATASCNLREKPWCERFFQIAGHVAAAGKEYGDLSRITPEGRTPTQEQRYTRLQADLTVARQEYADFLTQLESELVKAGTDYAVTESATDVLKSLRAEQGDLRTMGHGAVIVHYLTTPRRIRILLTTPDIQLHRDVELTKDALNHRIEDFRQALQSSRANPLPSSQALYQILIQPIEEDLKQAGAQTLMVSLPGALRYVPVGALYDPNRKQWIAERYAVVLYTEAARSHLNDKPQMQWRAAAFGMSQAAPPSFPALKSVPAELDGIVHDAQRHSHGVLPGVERLDPSFTAAELTRLLEGGQSDPARRYEVLHIASHFSLIPGDETASFLLLGDKTHLSLADFGNGPYPMSGVEILTLSACETAVGSGGKDGGREVDGLAAVAQNNGARSVLATLWSVADATTGVFMQRFYALRERGHLTKAEALRQVQLEFLSGGVNRANVTELQRGLPLALAPANEVASWMTTPDAPFSHPYFWAPFILMGNWQ